MFIVGDLKPGVDVLCSGRTFRLDEMQPKTSPTGNSYVVYKWSGVCKCGARYRFSTTANDAKVAWTCFACRKKVWASDKKRREVEEARRYDVPMFALLKAAIEIAPCPASMGAKASRDKLYAPSLLRRAWAGLANYTLAEIADAIHTATEHGVLRFGEVGKYKNRMPRNGLLVRESLLTETAWVKLAELALACDAFPSNDARDVIHAAARAVLASSGEGKKEPDKFLGEDLCVERDADPYAWFQPHPGNQHGRIMEFVKTHAVSDGCVTVADAVGVLARKDKLKQIKTFSERSVEDWVGASLSRLGVLEKEPDKFDGGLFD